MSFIWWYWAEVYQYVLLFTHLLYFPSSKYLLYLIAIYFNILSSVIIYFLLATLCLAKISWIEVLSIEGELNVVHQKISLVDYLLFSCQLYCLLDKVELNWGSKRDEGEFEDGVGMGEAWMGDDRCDKWNPYGVLIGGDRKTGRIIAHKTHKTIFWNRVKTDKSLGK